MLTCRRVDVRIMDANMGDVYEMMDPIMDAIMGDDHGYVCMYVR